MSTILVTTSTHGPTQISIRQHIVIESAGQSHLVLWRTNSNMSSPFASNYEEAQVMEDGGSDESGHPVDVKGDELFVDKPCIKQPVPWQPSGNKWRDFFYFVGPGWFVCIAYVDPGNFQADIQAGSTSRYSLLFALWWTSLLSLYVQILCVRLAYYGQVTLAEVQARDTPYKCLRYLNWFIAEVSAVLTDLPEVIGIGIALKIFFGWPYFAGVVLSLGTTLVFLASLRTGMKTLEGIIFTFVAIMSITLFVEMSFVNVDGKALMKGWVYGFTEISSSDLFSLTGILGSVVMPHNLYLHTATCQSRPVKRDIDIVKAAVWYSSWEPVVPIMVSFCVNVAIVSIAAERVYGTENADQVGLTDFCEYFQVLRGGCFLWAVSLLAAGQSSAITTTFTGQYVMNGFLKLEMPIAARAILTRLVAITPSVIISLLFTNKLNTMVNFVNSSIGLLLPFAFTPLVKYNCSQVYMGQFAARGWERWLLYSFAVCVYFVNAYSLSARGGGFFGDFVQDMEMSSTKIFYILLQTLIQLFYFGWNAYCILTPVRAPMTPVTEARPYDPQFALAAK